MGDVDLVRPLGLAGIPCVVAASPGNPARFSRYTVATLDYADAWTEPSTLLEILLQFGRQQPEPPVLYYETDGEMLLVAQRRDQLARHFRFVVPDADLALDLVDKARFATLAERLDLPVPRARRLDPTGELRLSELDVNYPFILKPITRKPGWGSVSEPLTHASRWGRIGAPAKVVEIESFDEMRRAWPRLRDAGTEFLAQELIRGPESCIESYHAYVSASGEVLGEFTGRKIRTWPVGYGHSTALETSDAPDVVELGRWCMQRMGLVGPAKFDFKRDSAGALHLLEVNPRYNLWHHLGAVAGVNLPAIAYADLTGTYVGPQPSPKVGLTWCKPWHDVLAARASGVSLLSWIRWAWTTDAKRGISRNDPWPLARAVLHRGRERLMTAMRGSAHS
jgi:predicted ATP-grasp superfamily ATP-dependent carboligase